MIVPQTIYIAKKLAEDIGQSVFFYPPLEKDSEMQLMLFCCSSLLDVNENTFQENGFKELVNGLKTIFFDEYGGLTILGRIESDSPHFCREGGLVYSGYNCYSLKEFSDIYGEFYMEENFDYFTGKVTPLYFFEKDGKKQYVNHSSETVSLSKQEFEENLYRIAIIDVGTLAKSEYVFGLKHDDEKEADELLEYLIKDRLKVFGELSKSYFDKTKPLYVYDLYDLIISAPFTLEINGECTIDGYSDEDLKMIYNVDDEKFKKLKDCFEKLQLAIAGKKRFCRAHKIELPKI